MTTKTKSKPRKPRPGFVRPNWREHLHPAFVAWWVARKKNNALPKIKDLKGSDRRFGEWYREAVIASRAFNAAKSQLADPTSSKIWSAIGQHLEIEGPLNIPTVPVGLQRQSYPQNPESSDLFRTLVFLKHGITFRELIHRIDIEQDRIAHKKLLTVHRDYLRLMCGADFGALKLKFSWDHFGIITEGLDFGLDKLSPEELADCLDEICPCGQKHSTEYLKKVRSRIKQLVRPYLSTKTGD